VIGFSRKSNAPIRVASTAVSIVAWPRHHDHRHRQLAGRRPLLEQRDAVDVGHPDVEQDQVDTVAIAKLASLGAHSPR
jgi:hypothetical protein